MPTSRTPEETVATLEKLPADKLLDFLTAHSVGDLDAAAKIGGGGLRKAELAALQPGGETGALLDRLERKAIFQHSRTLGGALMAALLPALATLRALAEGVAPGEAPGGDDKPAMALFLARTNMFAKVCEQRRLAALALFDLAEKLRVFDLARAYRAPDIEADDEADDEATLRRMAEEQGLGDLPGLPGNGKPERLLRSVPFAS